MFGQTRTRVEVDFPVLLDVDGRHAEDWNIISYPSTFVIDLASISTVLGDFDLDGTLDVASLNFDSNDSRLTVLPNLVGE